MTQTSDLQSSIDTSPAQELNRPQALQLQWAPCLNLAPSFPIGGTLFSEREVMERKNLGANLFIMQLNDEDKENIDPLRKPFNARLTKKQICKKERKLEKKRALLFHNNAENS